MDELQIEIFFPPIADETDPLAFSLVSLTEAIAQLDSESVAHGFLGGEFGYGARWENDVFVMRPFYWGDCDCGATERSAQWHAANPHAIDCFREELQRRFAKYDIESGYNAIADALRDPAAVPPPCQEDVPFGKITITRLHTHRRKPIHKRWRKACDDRDKAHARLTRELYNERGIEPSPYRCFCTCGLDERADEYFATEGHYPTCSVCLPNFQHKASGFEVRWYKWIGRDMEANQSLSRAELRQLFDDCARSLGHPQAPKEPPKE